MSREALRRAILEELARLAPEADLGALSPSASLREDLDLDSFDFSRFVIALDKRLGVAVPEADYAKLGTLEQCLDYLHSRTEAHGAPPRA